MRAISKLDKFIFMEVDRFNKDMGAVIRWSGQRGRGGCHHVGGRKVDISQFTCYDFEIALFEFC